jgi:hypothetical protein
LWPCAASVAPSSSLLVSVQGKARPGGVLETRLIRRAISKLTVEGVGRLNEHQV